MIDIEYIRSFFPPAIAIAERLKDVDLNHKKRDFSHLVFKELNAVRILQFPDVVAAL